MTTSSGRHLFDEPAPITLLNTVSVGRRGGIHDALADTADLKQWVRAVGRRFDLTPRRAGTELVDDAAAARLVLLRDAVRRLPAVHTQDPRPFGQSPVPNVRTATAIVNDSAALSAVWPEMKWDGHTAAHREVWSGGVFTDALTTVLARRTIDLVESADWQQLRACVAPRCAHYFIKNQLQRQWCTPACGNRARVARHTRQFRTG